MYPYKIFGIENVFFDNSQTVLAFVRLKKAMVIACLQNIFLPIQD